MVIVAFLLFWIGAELNAPWWYFLLLAVYGVCEVFAVGVEFGEDGDDYDS